MENRMGTKYQMQRVLRRKASGQMKLASVLNSAMPIEWQEMGATRPMEMNWRDYRRRRRARRGRGVQNSRSRLVKCMKRFLWRLMAPLSSQFWFSIYDYPHYKKPGHPPRRPITHYKSISSTMQQPTIHEKTLSLANASRPLTRLLTSVIIYAADSYPLTKPWLTSILANERLHAALPQVLEALQLLAQDLDRQVIYGPSATHISTADIPHFEHLNCRFIFEEITEDSCPLSEIAGLLDKFELQAQIPPSRLEELLWYDRSRFLKLNRFVHKTVSGETLKELEVDGESWSRATPVPTLLLTLEHCCELLLGSLGKQSPLQLYLLSGRIHFLHNKILNFPTKTLAEKTLSHYRYYLNCLHQDHSRISSLSSYIGVVLEYANVLVFYYKYRECENIIELAKKLVNLEIEFTGKLGRRTKFQSFDTPQLVMSLKERSQVQEEKTNMTQEDSEIDLEALQVPDAKSLVLKELDGSPKKQNSEIATSGYDEESILLDAPKLVEEEEVQKATEQKVLVTLCSLQYTWDTTPKDEILFQQISTSIQTLLGSKDVLSYPVLFSILLLRSLNEFPRIKNAERALDQFEKLKNNYNLKTEKDTNYLHSTSYYPQMDFIKLLASKYMDLGMTMSAVELYQAAQMHEQCIDGLIARNYKEKAADLAQKCLKENGKSPRLMCMLGDLKNDDSCIQLYEEAWELSGRRNPRSMRSLGWHYYRAKKLDKAAQCFKSATEANHYHPNTWFTLGCCYMQMHEYKKALPCFSECICIDDTQGEAWGNMATCYIYLEKHKQAYSTLEQAVKYSEGSWKMWANLLSVSLKLKKFYKYFECIEKLVNLEKSDLLTHEMLSKVTKIFQYQQESSDRRRSINTMKNRIDRLYTLLVKKAGQNPIVWRAIFGYNVQLDHYVSANYKHYKKLHEEGNIEPNDLLEGYETLESSKQTANEDLFTIRHNIVDSKQNELNMTMKVGWEDRKSVSEEVLVVMQEYIDVYQKYSPSKNEQAEKEFRLFVQGVKSKLEKCLERPIEFNGLK